MIETKGSTCQSCGSYAVRIGPIPGSISFAGRQLERILPGGTLYRCNNCNLVFRHPRLDKKEIDNLYRQGHSESWATPVTERADWQLVKEILADYPDKLKILDVGCFDGRLLDSLGTQYEKLGIEIHEEAVHQAESRNIKVIGRDFDQLQVIKDDVDAVLAMDVIEHVTNPLEFLCRLAEVVRPGGLILIGTGNSDALSWRIMGSAYWYCHIAEHISFINPRWITYAARILGLNVVHLRDFSHDDAGPWRRTRETLLNLLYKLSPTLFAKLRRFGAGHVDIKRFEELSDVPPYWLTAKDHILIVLQKSTLK